MPPRRGALSDRTNDSSPTIVPAFDPDAFARDSEVKLRSAAPEDGEPTIDQARRLSREGEHERALFLLTRLLELAPLHPEANALSTECRGALEKECLSAIGSESSVFVAAVSSDELKEYALDNVSGFLVSLLDGATSVEEVLDICALPRLLALRHLRGLVDRGIVTVGSGRTRRR
jgi:hypothetical protein